jgi:hypothetical protein
MPAAKEAAEKSKLCADHSQLGGQRSKRTAISSAITVDDAVNHRSPSLLSCKVVGPQPGVTANTTASGSHDH